MKPKIIYLVLLFFAVLYFAFSCSKEKIKTISSLIQLRQPGCQEDLSFVCNGAIPEFGSQQAFEDVYECLETEYEDYNDSMETAHVLLTDDAYDDLVDSLGFNEEATLDAWETNKGYVSMRTTVNVAENSWLANDMAGTDPFDNAMADIIFMTLVNSDGNVKIGTSLFHFGADGSQIEITNADCEELQNAITNPEYTSANVQRLQLSISLDTCRKIASENGLQFWANDGNRRFKWRIDFETYVVDCRAKTLMRNFRKKNHWKRAAASSYLYIGGQLWNNECNQSSSMSFNEKQKRRKRVTVRRWPFGFGNIKSGEIHGKCRPTADGPLIDTSIVW